MNLRALALAVVLAVPIPAGARIQSPAASKGAAASKEKGVSGTWTMSAEGYVLTLIVAQSGTKVSGTLEGPHGPMPVTGKFAKGRLTFAADGPDGVAGKLEISATGVLQRDGTLAGSLTSVTSGTLKWTAVRTPSH